MNENLDPNYSDSSNFSEMSVNKIEGMEIDENETTEVNISFGFFKKLVDLFENLKCKYKDPLSTRQEKMQILTLLPESWTQNEIKDAFQTTMYMVKLSRKLQKKKGLMSIPNPIYRK